MRTIDHINPYLRDLLKLRVEKESNWLRELKKDAAYYEALAEEYESQMLRYKEQLDAQRYMFADAQSQESASILEPFLRELRRKFAARYHPDAPEGSVEMMAVINRIFNELESEVRSPSERRK